MYSFLESSLFDSINDDKPGQMHQTQNASGGPQNTGTAFTHRPKEVQGGLQGSADPHAQKVYGGGHVATDASVPQVVQQPAGPIACRDSQAAAALEAVMKAQALAEKRIMTMENKIMGMLDQLSVTQQTPNKYKAGLSYSGLLGIGGIVILILLFVFFFQSRKKTPPMEFVMRQAVPQIVTGGAPLTPVVIGSSATNLAAPQTFLS